MKYMRGAGPGGGSFSADGTITSLRARSRTLAGLHSRVLYLSLGSIFPFYIVYVCFMLVIALFYAFLFEPW